MGSIPQCQPQPDATSLIPHRIGVFCFMFWLKSIQIHSGEFSRFFFPAFFGVFWYFFLDSNYLNLQWCNFLMPCEHTMNHGTSHFNNAYPPVLPHIQEDQQQSEISQQIAHCRSGGRVAAIFRILCPQCVRQRTRDGKGHLPGRSVLWVGEAQNSDVPFTPWISQLQMSLRK